MHFTCFVRKCTIFCWQRNEYGGRIDSSGFYVSSISNSFLFRLIFFLFILNFGIFAKNHLCFGPCTVSSMPDTKVLSFEHNDLHDYDNAHRMGRDNVYCTTTYRDCSISLIELALGGYSKPYNFM